MAHRRLATVALSAFTVILSWAAPTGAAPGGEEPDTDALPDLVVREDKLATQWLIRDEDLSVTDACGAEEAGVEAGPHRILRMTVMTPNIGEGDVFLGDPNDHVEAGDGLYEFSECHGHYHFRHYTEYSLVDVETGKPWRSAKVGFCMLDTDPNPAWMGTPPGAANYDKCGRPGIEGYQGISAGWTDTYRFDLTGQYFVLDGGDGQDPVPPGIYKVVIRVNPPYSPAPGEPCRALDDNTGLCHQIAESDYTNNEAEAEIVIPDHVGRGGVGPLASSPAPGGPAPGHS